MHQPISQLALPPLFIGGESQHIFCSIHDAAELLASVEAWLLLERLVCEANLSEAQVWEKATAAYRLALTQCHDPKWRKSVLDRISGTAIDSEPYLGAIQAASYSTAARTVH